ncbi:MAG: biopolymer transporter ExbD [Deltaproteobacteria bacterium]|nr:biopolymer transporter ExbD [Deltaproteobacteria bacterium]
MMNVLFMLVLVLMGMSAFLPIGIIQVQAPQFGGAPVDPKDRDIHLTIMLLKSGINLSVAGDMLRGKNGPLLPKISNGPELAYNFSALQQQLQQLKTKYPREKRIIIMANPDVIYNDITHTMDAARVSASGKTMFDEVAFVPGVLE